MTRAALKLVSPLSPERQHLAEAIAEAAPKRAEVDTARTRAEAARGALAAALGAVPAAERAVAESKARLIENPGADRSELRSLRQAEVDARDDLEIACEVAARAEEALTEAERSVRYVMEKIEAAADRVIVGSFAPALAAAERAGREFGRLAYAAAIVAQAGNFYDGERTRLGSQVDTLNPHFAFRGDTDAIEAAQHAAQTPWRLARAALLADPSALLPEIK